MSFDAGHMRDLLARAVQCLDSPPAPGASSQGPSTSTSTPNPVPASPVASLFNFGKSSARKGKGKGKKRLRSSMWCHDFIALSCPDQDKTPTPLERSKLATAGELVCRFTVLILLCYRQCTDACFCCTCQQAMHAVTALHQ